MAVTRKTLALTHDGAMKMLAAGIEKATEIGQPQCIVIVDASGETLAQLRMTGAKFISLKSARTKARTAASNRAPSALVPESFRTPIAFATQGEVTGIGGGLPIIIDDEVIGGVGIGSGSADQDMAVANAALVAIGAQTFE
ncbi:MAG: heme-binding protein [Burkholderiaceae bacterium]